MSPAALPATPRIFTRRQYVRDGSITHHAYHSQFVTAETLRAVEGAFGRDALVAALRADQHLNSIPLTAWDSMSIQELGTRSGRTGGSSGFITILPFDRQAAAAAGESVTRATMTCIAKAAARSIATTKVGQHRQEPERLQHEHPSVVEV